MSRIVSYMAMKGRPPLDFLGRSSLTPNQHLYSNYNFTNKRKVIESKINETSIQTCYKILHFNCHQTTYDRGLSV